MPKKTVTGRRPAGIKGAMVMNHTNALWTILSDGSFWTVHMDEEGGYCISLHGAVTSQATFSQTFTCPHTNKKVAVLMFDVVGFRNGTIETHGVRVLPECAERVISWTTGAITSCHAVIDDLCASFSDSNPVTKYKGTCHCNESHPLVSCFLVVPFARASVVVVMVALLITQRRH